MKHASPFRLFACILLPLLLLSSPAPGAVTGRNEDTSLAGTEKVLSDSSGTDTYITVTKLWTSPVITTGLTASGSAANDFSASTGAFKTSTGLNTFGGSGHAFAAILYPASNDGAALGDTTHNFSDLFLASGAVINYADGNVAITHTSGILTMGTGELRITTAGTNAASVPTLGSTSTLTNKTLTAPVINGATSSGSTAIDFSGNSGAFKSSTGLNTFGGSGHAFAAKLYPSTDDGAALGDTTHHFSDLFLATGAVLNFNNGNVAITHSSGILTMGTGELRITTAGTNAASVPTLGSTSTLTNKTLTAPVVNTPTVKDLTEVVTATNTIAASETGSVFFLNSATEFVSTLPAPAAGLHFTFIVTAAPSGASYTVVTNASGNVIKGMQNSVAGDAGDSGTADDTITFVDGQAVAGDRVEVYCDGTNWFAYATTKLAAGLTFTQAD